MRCVVVEDHVVFADLPGALRGPLPSAATEMRAQTTTNAVTNGGTIGSGVTAIIILETMFNNV